MQNIFSSCFSFFILFIYLILILSFFKKNSKNKKKKIISYIIRHNVIISLVHSPTLLTKHTKKSKAFYFSSSKPNIHFSLHSLSFSLSSSLRSLLVTSVYFNQPPLSLTSHETRPFFLFYLYRFSPEF